MMGWFTGDGETRKETNPYGEDIEVHFDESGKKIGETRTKQGFSGTFKETTDNKGRKVSETRKEFRGTEEVEVTRTRNGGESITRRESTGYGTKETHRQNGRTIGESQVDKTSSEGYRKLHTSKGRANFDPTTRSDRTGYTLRPIQKGNRIEYVRVYDKPLQKTEQEVEEESSSDLDPNDFLPSESRVFDHSKIEELLEDKFPQLPSKLPRLVISELDSAEDVRKALSSNAYFGISHKDTYENTYRCTACGHEWKARDYWERPDVDCEMGCSNPSLFQVFRAFLAGRASTGHGKRIGSKIVRDEE